MAHSRGQSRLGLTVDLLELRCAFKPAFFNRDQVGLAGCQLRPNPGQFLVVGSYRLEFMTKAGHVVLDLGHVFLRRLELEADRGTRALGLGVVRFLLRGDRTRRRRRIEASRRCRRALCQPARIPARPTTGSSIVDHKHVINGAIEEGAVVADDDDDAGPVVKEILERPKGVEIEVVRRLIEEQDVGLGSQRQNELEAPTLAAGKQPDRRPLSIGVEPEPFKKRDIPPVRLRSVAGQGLTHAQRRIELTPLLIMEPYVDRWARNSPAGERFAAPADHVEQGRLTRPVRANDPEPLAPIEKQFQPLDQWCSRLEPDSDIVQFDHLIAEPRSAVVQCGEVKIAQPGFGLRSSVDDVGCSFNPSSTLAGTRFRSPAQPCELASSKVLAGLFVDRRPLLTSGAPFQVPGVAALVGVSRATVEFEDPRRNAIEYRSVVGDDNQPALELCEFVFEPLNSVDVEMVGRLVQHQQFGLGDKRTRKRHPLLLPARELVGGAVDQVGETKPVNGGLTSPVAPHRRAHRTLRKRGHLINGRNRHAPPATHLPPFGIAGSGDDRQKCRFARPIDADHPQAVTTGYRDRDVGKERTVRSAHADAVDVDEDHVAQTTTQLPTLGHPIADALAARAPWQPAPLTHLLTGISGAVRSVAAAIDGIERTWHDIAVRSLHDTGAIPYRPEATSPETPPVGRPPIWVVLGDSTAQGIGASSLDHGWVPRIETALADAKRRHAVINLSRSGADSAHVIHEQLPLLDHLPYAPSLVTICVGANDLMRNPYPPRLARRLSRLAEAAPPGTVISTLPAPRFSPTGIHVNRSIRHAAAEHGHLVAELGPHLVGPWKGLSADRFHPNDVGYGAWVNAFAEPLGIEAALVPVKGTFTSVVRAPAMRGTTASG